MKIAALQFALLSVVLAGCDGPGRGGPDGRDPTGPPELLQIAGGYRVTHANGSPSCTSPLPPPPDPDEDPNDFVVIGPFSVEVRIEVQQNGPRIDWIVIEVDGMPATEVPLLGNSLTGRLDEQGDLAFTTQHEFREAARQDSLRYHVTWALDATSHFRESGGVIDFETTGVSTYTYRTSPTGPVTTICTVPTTSSGMRTSVPD